MKETVVHFHEGRVEKLTNPDKSSLPGDYVVEPDLTRVAGIPPEYWQLIDGEIFPQEGHSPDPGSIALVKQRQETLANIRVVESIYADSERKYQELKKEFEIIAQSVTDYTQEQCLKLHGEYKAFTDRVVSEVYFTLKRELKSAKDQRKAFLKSFQILTGVSVLFFLIAVILNLWGHFV